MTFEPIRHFRRTMDKMVHDLVSALEESSEQARGGFGDGRNHAMGVNYLFNWRTAESETLREKMRRSSAVCIYRRRRRKVKRMAVDPPLDVATMLAPPRASAAGGSREAGLLEGKGSEASKSRVKKRKIRVQRLAQDAADEGVVVESEEAVQGAKDKMDFEEQKGSEDMCDSKTSSR